MGDRSVYVGEKSKEGKKFGFGTMFYEDGCIYTGTWKNNKQHGEGTFDWGDGNKYSGKFKIGKQHGYGVYVWPTGGKYEGEWQDDKMQGKGTYRRNDGVIYIGQWKNDHQYGLGFRVIPEKIEGETRTWKRKTIFYEVWDKSQQLKLSKQLDLYPKLEQFLPQPITHDEPSTSTQEINCTKKKTVQPDTKAKKKCEHICAFADMEIHFHSPQSSAAFTSMPRNKNSFAVSSDDTHPHQSQENL